MVSQGNQNQTGTRVVPTFCALCGPQVGCGVNCFVENGRLVRVEGMKESPLNRGKLCPRAFVSAQWLYSPDRLKYPLKRVGTKGEGRFQRISWDEAIDIIADKLKAQKEKYGPESLAILSPARRTYSDFLFRFLIVHGSPNYGHGGICAVQRSFIFSYTLGTGTPPCDFDNTELIVIWGANQAYGGPRSHMKQILDAKERGTKVIAIKPQLQSDVAKADIWLPIIPGTDGALALAMLHVIVNKKLYNKEFVEKWCYGFDKLIPHIQKYTPRWAEPITGIPASNIEEVARLYATAKSACILTGNVLDQMVDCSNVTRTIAIMMAITGNFDRRGGNVVPTGTTMPRVKPVNLTERYTKEMVDKLVAPEMPRALQPFGANVSAGYYGCIDSVITGKPYQVKTIIAPGTQPTVITRNSRRVIEALKKLEFFVVIDVMDNASMPWADIVMPVASMYECDHPFEAAGNWIMARNKVVEPQGDYKSDYQFWLDLAVKMGYGDDFWQGSIEKCMDYQLENFGITMDELRKYPHGITYPSQPMVYEKYEKILATPSSRLSKAPHLPPGKVAVYNTTFEENGFNPLPEWSPSPESLSSTPQLLEKYPLVFCDTHSSAVYNQAWLRNVPYLRDVLPDPWIQIHPETARARGIRMVIG